MRYTHGGKVMPNRDEEIKQWVLASRQDDPFMGQAPLSPNVPRSTIPLDGIKNEEKDIEDKVVSSHPMTKFDPLSTEVNSNIAKINQYGPEQQQETVNSLLKAQNSLPNRFAKAGAALSDALMQGVARAGNPGNLQNLENEEQKNLETQANLIPTLQSMTGRQIAQTQNQAGMTSDSALGKAKADTLMPILMKLYPGKTQQEYNSMLRNPDAAAASLGIAAPIFESMAKERMAEAELGLRKTTTEAAIEDKEKQREVEENKNRTDAASTLLRTNSGYNPFNWKARHEAGNVLREAIKPQENFDHASIPSGTVYTAPDGTKRIKK